MVDCPCKVEIFISGAKNSVVASQFQLLSADDICDFWIVFPDSSVFASLVEIMELIGATVKRYDDVKIDQRYFKIFQCLMGKSVVFVILLFCKVF